jgi:hypothetical protein
MVQNPSHATVPLRRTLFYRVITKVFRLSIRYLESENIVAHIGEKVDEGSSEDYDASDDGYPGNTVHCRETKETKEKFVIKHSVIGGRGKTLLACQSPFTSWFAILLFKIIIIKKIWKLTFV